jgi:hypothetical protein
VIGNQDAVVDILLTTYSASVLGEFPHLAIVCIFSFTHFCVVGDNDLYIHQTCQIATSSISTSHSSNSIFQSLICRLQSFPFLGTKGSQSFIDENWKLFHFVNESISSAVKSLY